jgi:D-ribose pyranose/furanose isomerase RbsD
MERMTPMGDTAIMTDRIVRVLRKRGFDEHEARHIAGIVVPEVQPARVAAMCRVLVRSGDMTPYAAMRVRAALGLPATPERRAGDDDDE